MLKFTIYESFLNNVDPRRRQERQDSRMVQEDQKAMSNLSETPVYKEFNAWRNIERFNMFNESDR